GGRAYLFLGSPAGLSASPAWIVEGDQLYGQFGCSVAAAGDVNGDGYGDVVIGAENRSIGESTTGRAFVYHGSPSGLSATPDWIFDGERPDARLGTSVAGAGDVNGDGFADVVIGAPGRYSMGAHEGSAYVFHGSPTGLAAAPAWVQSGVPLQLFGASVATAGDVNADGYADVIIGAPRHSNGQDQEGKALVTHGSPNGHSTSPAWTVESNQALAYFGASVSTAGDTNGDGFADVIIGSPNFDRAVGDRSGLAFVYYGSA